MKEEVVGEDEDEDEEEEGGEKEEVEEERRWRSGRWGSTRLIFQGFLCDLEFE